MRIRNLLRFSQKHQLRALTLRSTSSSQGSARDKPTENHSVGSTEQYFRVTVYVPYADRLIEKFNVLFRDLRSNVARLQFLVPKYIERGSVKDLVETFSFYEADLTSSVSVVTPEYSRWRLRWIDTASDDRPVTAIDALDHCCPQSLPNISTLLKIFAILSVTTASAERTLSVLRILKTYLRSTMSEHRLNGLTSMQDHRDVEVAANEVIDELAKNPRKLNRLL